MVHASPPPARSWIERRLPHHERAGTARRQAPGGGGRLDVPRRLREAHRGRHRPARRPRERRGRHPRRDALAFGGGSAPSVATDGTQFFVAWSDLALNRLAGAARLEGWRQDRHRTRSTSARPSPTRPRWHGTARRSASRAPRPRSVGANGTPRRRARRRQRRRGRGQLFVIQNVGADASRKNLAPARVSGSLLEGGRRGHEGRHHARGAAAPRRAWPRPRTARAALGGSSTGHRASEARRRRLRERRRDARHDRPGHGKNGARRASPSTAPRTSSPGPSRPRRAASCTSTTPASSSTPEVVRRDAPLAAPALARRQVLHHAPRRAALRGSLGTTDREVALTPERPAGR